jgi:hypothetical protein
MKSRLFHFSITIILLLTGLKVSPQVFYSGLQLGLNGSQVAGDEMSGFNKGGLLAGVFVDLPVTERSSFTLELNYTMKGSRRVMNEDNTSPGLWNLLRISYLEVPIFYNYRVTEKVDFIAAFSHALKVGVKYVDVNGYEIDYDFIRPYEFGFYIGGNYRPGNKFIFSLRGGASLYTIGEGKSYPIWAYRNDGMLNIVTSFSVKYYYMAPK